METEQVAFEMFATAYPHEAHEKDPQKFCDFVRSKGNELTDEQIVEVLNSTKETYGTVEQRI